MGQLSGEQRRTSAGVLLRHQAACLMLGDNLSDLYGKFRAGYKMEDSSQPVERMGGAPEMKVFF